jgi:aspartate/methionine/tyrosine aminotransferase
VVQSVEYRKSLTSWEWRALGSSANLSDGHARGWISGVHRRLVDRLGELYESSIYVSQDAAQADFLEAFSSSTGQLRMRDAPGAFFHHSASSALDAVFAWLRQEGVGTLSLITPSFDNLAALARRRGLQLEPVEEHILWDSVYAREIFKAHPPAIMLVSPNNPTGAEFTQRQFEKMAEESALNGTIFIIDASFRFFSRDPSWDMYNVLRSTPGLRWCVIEDTGKAFGLSELKVGLAVCDELSEKTLAQVTDDLLLNVSPFILKALSYMMSIRQGERSHLEELRDIIQGNRDLMRLELASVRGAKILSSTSKSSVEWVLLTEGPEAEFVCKYLMREGIHVLPGHPFYWEKPERGSRNLRFALARDPRYFEDSLRRAIPMMKRIAAKSPAGF